MPLPIAAAIPWLLQFIIVPTASWIVVQLAKVLSNQAARKALLLAVYAVAVVFFFNYLGELTGLAWQYLQSLLPNPAQAWFRGAAQLAKMVSVWLPWQWALTVAGLLIGFKAFLLFYHYAFVVGRAALAVARAFAG